MTRPSVDQWAFSQITAYAERGTCFRRKVGALGLDSYGRIVGIGMNGVPRDYAHCTEASRCAFAEGAPGTPCNAIHAEINMILNSSNPYSIETVYVSATPCFECCKVLANLPNLKIVRAITQYSDVLGWQFLRARGIFILVGYTVE